MDNTSSAGGIKSNVGPLVADQYTGKKPVVKITADNRRVILDPDVTVQTIYSRYYWYVAWRTSGSRR